MAVVSAPVAEGRESLSATAQKLSGGASRLLRGPVAASALCVLTVYDFTSVR